jgi:lysophospholipase L1-like esterase
MRIGRLISLALLAGLIGIGLLRYLRPDTPRDGPFVDDSFQVVEPAAPAGTPRLLALGDSYTIGQDVTPAERWPVQLVERLRRQGVTIADPTIIARTGWTTDELTAALDRTELKERYTLVTLLIGVNNQYRGRDLGEYRTQFADLLARAVGYAGGRASRVLVLSIPDWGVTPFGRTKNPAAIATAIDASNGVNREETVRVGAHYVEITIASRRAGAEPDLLALDGLHPSGKMYAQWAEVALPAALEALARD